ncbi:DUF4271 domain-containing protein [Porphyromonas macacae]|uniref:DUF4271 domain-containing protein n=1 Tax=Porphyromonas macacae TaxID=28115 RepID=UPI003D1547DF
MNDFWINQHSSNFFIGLMIFTWLLTAIIIRQIPAVIQLTAEVIRHKRVNEFSTHLKRFTRPFILNTLIHIIETICISMAFYHLYLHRQVISLANFYNSIKLFFFLFIVIFLFMGARRGIYKLITTLFLREETRNRFHKIYHIIELIFALLLTIPATLLWISNISIFILYVMLALFIIWRIVVCLVSIGYARYTEIGIIHLLLYLCIHELLPFVYIYYGINYMINNDIYLTLFV